MGGIEHTGLHSMKMKKKHLNTFMKECERWIKFYGLTEWDINYSLADIGDDNAANTFYDLPSMSATIVLSDEYPVEFATDKYLVDDIKESAHHEVLELLLAKMHVYAMSPCGCNEFIEEAARHEIIMKLSNCVYKRKGKKI